MNDDGLVCPLKCCCFFFFIYVAAINKLFSAFQTGNKKEAERLVKNIIKIVIKIGVLHRNNQFNADEINAAERFRQKFQVRILFL